MQSWRRVFPQDLRHDDGHDHDEGFKRRKGGERRACLVQHGDSSQSHILFLKDFIGHANHLVALFLVVQVHHDFERSPT